LPSYQTYLKNNCCQWTRYYINVGHDKCAEKVSFGVAHEQEAAFVRVAVEGMQLFLFLVAME
jgi:hypothetical protein